MCFHKPSNLPAVKTVATPFFLNSYEEKQSAAITALEKRNEELVGILYNCVFELRARRAEDITQGYRPRRVWPLLKVAERILKENE